MVKKGNNIAARNDGREKKKMPSRAGKAQGFQKRKVVPPACGRGFGQRLPGSWRGKKKERGEKRDGTPGNSREQWEVFDFF